VSSSAARIAGIRRFFCGSCAVVRRSALERIGGFATGTITEDLHTSIRLHAAGFRSVYHAEPLAFGLAPESIEPFITQRVRWGRGRHARVAHRGHPLQSGLELGAAAQLPLPRSPPTFDGWTKGLFYFAHRRGVALRVRAAGGRDADVLAAFRAVLPAHVLGVRGGWARLRPHRLHRAIQHGALRGFCLGDAGLDLPKRPVPGYPQAVARAALLRFTMPQWLVAGSNLLAVPVGIAIYRHAHLLPLAGVAANVLWAGVNADWQRRSMRHTLAVQRRQRAQYRFPVPLPAELDFAGLRMHGTIDNLSENGIRFYGGLLAYIEPGSEFSGRLTLPDGPLPFTGQVRTLIPLEGHPGTFKAFGGVFNATPGDQKRIEPLPIRFGSAMGGQWLLRSGPTRPSVV